MTLEELELEPHRTITDPRPVSGFMSNAKAYDDYEYEPHDWKCPRCGLWVNEDIGKVCRGCVAEEKSRNLKLLGGAVDMVDFGVPFAEFDPTEQTLVFMVITEDGRKVRAEDYYNE